MKIGLQSIFGLLAAIFLVVFLSWSYFQPAVQAPVQAVEDLGQYEPHGGDLGEVRCDRIIPIGEPLEATVNLMAQILTEQQNGGGYVKSASGNLQNIFAQLSKDKKFVCDFRNCSPVFVDVGLEFTLEIDALVKKFELGGHAPIPSDKECAGSPCPDLGDEKTGPIGALTGWLAAVEESRNRVKAIFEDATIVVTEDIAQGDLGEKITQQEAIRRKAAKAAVMVKECSLSDVEKKMVLSGRLGNKYPMTCKDAIDAGQYWPLPWSEVCKKECDDGNGSDACIKCLQEKKPDLTKASILGRLNYKIYRTCDTDYFNEKDANGKSVIVERDACHNKTTGDWELSEACIECLCTDTKVALQNLANVFVPLEVIRTKMTDDECMAFLCGGSKRNWTCCHQAPIEFSGDMEGSFATVEEIRAVEQPPGSGTYVMEITTEKISYVDAYNLAKAISENYTGPNGVNKKGETVDKKEVVDPLLIMANIYKESTFYSQAGGCKMDDTKTYMKENQKEALKEIAEELNLDAALVPLSCGFINADNEAESGGAMGPAQFMPVTWRDEVKEKLENIPGAVPPANPWSFKDAFLASALKLDNDGANYGDTDSEKHALKHYGGSTAHVTITMCFKKAFQGWFDSGCSVRPLPASAPAICADKNLTKELDKCR